MRVNRASINNQPPAFNGAAAALQRKAASTFANIDGIGEGASIAFDFLGKAVVVPAVIMLASKEPKEKKEYSALKNPVAAIIQLALEVPILLFGSKAIEKAANNGAFDIKEKKTYNEKFHKDTFINTVQNTVKENPDNIKKAEELINSINTKGLSRKAIEGIEGFIETLPEKTKSITKKAFEDYSSAHKKLYHLQNRLCFAAAIILTPIICALENKLHPVIMDKIYEKEAQIANKNSKAQVLKQGIYTMQKGAVREHISIHSFIANLKKGGAK